MGSSECLGDEVDEVAGLVLCALEAVTKVMGVPERDRDRSMGGWWPEVHGHLLLPQDTELKITGRGQVWGETERSKCRGLVEASVVGVPHVGLEGLLIEGGGPQWKLAPRVLN